MGGYVQVMVGINVEESDFFEVVTEEVVHEDKWDGDGPVPKFHPDKGVQLRTTRKVRKLLPSFAQLEEGLTSSYMQDRWRNYNYEVDWDSLSNLLPLDLKRTYAPDSFSGWVLGKPLWGSGDLDCKGPEIDEMGEEDVQKTFQAVRGALTEMGFNQEPSVCFMSGWS